MPDVWHVTRRTLPYPRSTDGRLQVDLWGHPFSECRPGCSTADPEYIGNEAALDAPPAHTVYDVEAGTWQAP